MNLQDKLKSIRIENDLTMEELAKIFNTKYGFSVSKGTVSRWESGKTTPLISYLSLYAKEFNISLDSLLGLNNEKDISSKLNRTEQTIQVPLVGYIAAGSPILAEENIEDYYNIDKRIKADFCLKVKGDSMIGSHILDGDIAFIKSQPTLENGEIGAVLVSGNTATLKKVYVNKENVILQPSNVNYQPIIISGQDLTEFRILGKLVANLSPKDL